MLCLQLLQKQDSWLLYPYPMTLVSKFRLSCAVALWMGSQLPYVFILLKQSAPVQICSWCAIWTNQQDLQTPLLTPNLKQCFLYGTVSYLQIEGPWDTFSLPQHFNLHIVSHLFLCDQIREVDPLACSEWNSSIVCNANPIKLCQDIFLLQDTFGWMRGFNFLYEDPLLICLWETQLNRRTRGQGTGRGRQSLIALLSHFYRYNTSQRKKLICNNSTAILDKDLQEHGILGSQCQS